MSNASLKRKFDSSSGNNSVPTRSEFLNDKLSRRPDRHQLVEQRILHDSQCAPSLQHAEQALKRARLVDELNNRLLNRPGPLDLIQHNILHIDTTEYPNLEQAIQGGQIPFNKTPSTSRRPLIFHEYTGSPSSCKPKVTKIDSLSSASNAHQIRLAQQQLLLELTSNNLDEQTSLSLPQKSLEQMTLVELRNLCKQYQIPSSHASKNTLIERIKQSQYQQNQKQDNDDNDDEEILLCEQTNNDIPNIDIISSLQISDINEAEIEPLSESELDEILKYFPSDSLNRNEDQTSTNDDSFVQMLLDDDNSINETTFDDLFFSDILQNSSTSSLPKITSVDEFDAFLRDFTHNILSYQQEVSTPIS